MVDRKVHDVFWVFGKADVDGDPAPAIGLGVNDRQKMTQPQAGQKLNPIALPRT